MPEDEPSPQFRTEADRSAAFTQEQIERRESRLQSLHDRVTNDFGYHKATPQTGPMHDQARRIFADVAHWAIDAIPEGRDQSLCITALEDALMRANKAIATTLSPLEG